MTRELKLHSHYLGIFFAALSFGSLYSESIPIENSKSPTGQFSLAIVPLPDGGLAHGTAEIVRNQDGKIAGTFDWAGFGVTPDSTAFHVLWNSNERSLAISWELNRGYTTCAVYALEKGRWQRAALPNYVSQILKREKLTDGGGKGYEIPKKWLPGNTLKVQIYERNVPYDYWAFLKLEDSPTGPKMVLTKLERKPPSP